MAKRDKFTKNWILEHGIPIVKSYKGNVTLRQLHYRLVSIGMTNSLNHYKRVVNAMIYARWEGLLNFYSFLDHDRETLGFTDYKPTSPELQQEKAESQVRAWMKTYYKNRWENQDNYVEVFIEKKALQGVFAEPCNEWDVALNPCKGYPSLTFLFDAKERFHEAYEAGKNPIMLYFGDHDPSGDDIPRSIKDNLWNMGLPEIEIKRIALTKDQVIEWNLPPAPTKSTDTRSVNWDGLGQVELDAVMPEDLTELCIESIKDCFDEGMYEDLIIEEDEEREEFQNNMREYVRSL